MAKTFFLADEEATLAFGGRVGPLLRRGDVLRLHGDLGAGKTCFTRGVAAHFGVQDAVSSPTFDLCHVYDGAGETLYHFDLYRIESFDELQAAGLDELITSGTICLIEWSDVAEPLFPGLCVSELAFAYEGEGRAVTVTGPLEERL